MQRMTLLLLMVMLAGCNQQPSAPPAPPPADPAVVARIVEGNSTFALDLYSRLRNQPGNLVVSPYSVSSAFALTLPGTRGGTADEIRKVFHFPDDSATFDPAFANLAHRIRTAPGVDIRIANALFGQKGYGFLPEFLEHNQRFYGAGLREVDFRNPELARSTINGWVGEQTLGLIPDLLAPDTLSDQTQLMLANAIYFKGQWANRFVADRTQPDFFYPKLGEAVQVPTMTQRLELPFLETRDAQIAEFAYQGKAWSMVIVLPRKVDGLPAIESALTPGLLLEWVKALRPTEVEVFLPKFRLTREVSLRDTLIAMGMPSAFDPTRADLTGMAAAKFGEPLFIGQVLHKAFLEVSEEGTEAAAATVVEVVKEAARGDGETKSPVFRANRPFLYLIRDRESGSILFLGRVMDPKE